MTYDEYAMEEPKQKTVTELLDDLIILVKKQFATLSEENQRLFDRVHDLESKVEDLEYKAEDIEGKVEDIDLDEIGDFQSRVESLESDLEDLKDTLRNV